ncbi:trypsin-like serine peptidase [Nocardiopsis xinjiangensis]|uniref:trypsin-like serine peptidase n=1 Tax=Nocardiopsis xinjiangensis TaxID=124285 RepID=UPI00034CC1A8|nr:serine protease [Nocardiopsis xinjiangensis]
MSASAHHNSTPDWQFRITDRDGGVLHGAAVLVSPDHVLTCAHVVRAAAGEDGPGARVRLDAPRHSDTWHTRAAVVEGGWWWDEGPAWDAALLRLDGPAPAVPAPIGTPGPHIPHGHPVHILGFPHAPAGRWLTGLVRGAGGARPEYVQIDVDPSAPVAVTRGFSGSGVRSNDGTLLGIVREAGAEGRLAWMVPVTAVPGLRPGPRAAPGLDHEQLHALAVAVSDLETIVSREVRALFVSALDPRLRRRIDAAAVPAVFSHDLVLRAHRDYEVLDEVLDQLAAWEEASAPMRRVQEAAAPLLRGCGDT